jgi:hypothetical protein
MYSPNSKMELTSDIVFQSELEDGGHATVADDGALRNTKIGGTHSWNIKTHKCNHDRRDLAFRLSRCFWIF